MLTLIMIIKVSKTEPPMFLNMKWKEDLKCFQMSHGMEDRRQAKVVATISNFFKMQTLFPLSINVALISI